MSLAPGDEEINRLFKYRKNDDSTIKMLQTQEVYFPFPHEINDPFDCKFPVSFDGTEADIVSWLSKLPLNPVQRRMVLEGYRSGKISKSELVKSHHKKEYRAVVIYCMSEVRDNQLMWSHYANGHQGICIGLQAEVYKNSLCIRFDDPLLKRLTDLYIEDYLPVSKIEYSSTRPEPYYIFRGTATEIKPHILAKSNIWEYEKERRIVVPFPRVGSQKLRLAKASFKDIYLGANIKDEYIERLYKVLKAEFWTKGYDVKLYRMECSNFKYELETIDYNL